MIIELNTTEQRLAKYIARCRYEYDRTTNAQSTVYGAETPEFRELNSVGAELAFCKMNNIYPDLDTEHFGIEDCLLNDGRLVDVKSTTLEHGKLMVKAIARKGKSDIFALIVGTFPRFRFAGWLPYDEVCKQERKDTKLPHPAFVAKQHELTKQLF